MRIAGGKNISQKNYWLIWAREKGEGNETDWGRKGERDIALLFHLLICFLCVPWLGGGTCHLGVSGQHLPIALVSEGQEYFYTKRYFNFPVGFWIHNVYSLYFKLFIKGVASFRLGQKGNTFIFSYHSTCFCFPTWGMLHHRKKLVKKLYWLTSCRVFF